MKIPLELAGLEILRSADDAPLEVGANDVPDCFDTFLEKATFAANAGPGGASLGHNLAVESAGRNAAVAAHYKKLADAPAQTKSTPSTALAKSEMTSRMFGVLEEIRGFCLGEEAARIEKAIRALDIGAFAELTERVLARMKHAAACT